MNYGGAKKYTVDPVYVGSTVLGIRYNNGIAIGADIRLNYGSLCKFNNITERVQRLNINTIITSTGEFSDFQEITKILKEEAQEDSLNINSYLGPNELTHLLSLISYNRRNKMNPYFLSTLIGGIGQDNKPILSMVDQFGTLLTGDYLVTGLGYYFCNAILAVDYPDDHKKLNREEAIELLHKCFGVLYCRDTRSGDTIKYGSMEYNEATNSNLYEEITRKVKTNWDYSQFLSMNNEKFYLNK